MIQRKSAEDRKTDIVTALLLLADRIGPDRLTTNDIAREVGVSQAAIFRHFPTKADLWCLVGEMIEERLQVSWQESAANGSTPRDRLRALIAAQLRQIEACPALPSILHSRELILDNASLRKRFRNLLMQFQQNLKNTLEDMRADGSIGAFIAPADAAILLTSLVQGTAIRWSLGARSFSLHDEGLRILDVQLALFACKDGFR